MFSIFYYRLTILHFIINHCIVIDSTAVESVNKSNGILLRAFHKY